MNTYLAIYLIGLLLTASMIFGAWWSDKPPTRIAWSWHVTFLMVSASVLWPLFWVFFALFQFKPKEGE